MMQEKRVKGKVEQLGEKLGIFLIIFCLGLLSYAVYFKPKLLENQVAVNKQTSIQQLGDRYKHYSVEQCADIPIMTCQQMQQYGIVALLIWHKGLDLVIVGGFDKNDKVVYRTHGDFDMMANQNN